MNSIIFWFDQPPKVGKGCFNAVTKMWEGKVYYAYLKGFSDTRKKVNWDDGDFGEAIVIELEDNDNTAIKIKKIIEENSDAINVLCGFKSLIMKYLEGYVLSDKYTFICFAERPGIYGKWWKRIIKRVYIPLSEKQLARKYMSHVKAFLPLGMTGVKTYASFGWNKDILFPFMYDPVCYVNPDTIKETCIPIKFLYVGRFSKYTKGTDILKEAVNLLKDNVSTFTLTLVGGYGDMRDEMINWANQNPNVSYQGRWDSLEVGVKMTDYDVCIVPSKFDGWNLLVNEAIRANVAVIASDEAVSDEVIKKAGAGLVVKAKSSRLLAEAMQTAIDNPQIVNTWKLNAKAFKSRISNQAVAQYFLDVINYSCFDDYKGNRPRCPWIDVEREK